MRRVALAGLLALLAGASAQAADPVRPSGPRVVVLDGGHGPLSVSLDGRPLTALEGGETLVENKWGDLEATVRIQDLTARVEGLAAAAVQQCDLSGFDARAAMRRAMARGWPRFINPDPAHDYAPDEVFAEGRDQIVLRATGASNVGRVGLMFSEGRHHAPLEPNRFALCSVSFGATPAGWAEDLVKATWGERLVPAWRQPFGPDSTNIHWTLKPPAGQAAWPKGQGASVHLWLQPGAQAVVTYSVSEARPD